MQENEQLTAKVLIGSLIFVIVFMVLRDLALPSLFVSLASPNLSAGPFDIWSSAIAILAPLFSGYVFVASKIGGSVVLVISNLLLRMRSTSDSAKPGVKYADAAKAQEAFSKLSARLKAVEQTIEQWKEE